MDLLLLALATILLKVLDKASDRLSEETVEQAWKLLHKIDLKDIPLAPQDRFAWLLERLAKLLSKDDSLRDIARSLVGNPLGYDENRRPFYEERAWSGLRLPVYSWYSKYLLSAGNPALPAVDDAILLLLLDRDDALMTSFPEHHREGEIPTEVLRPDPGLLKKLIALSGAQERASKYLATRRKSYRQELEAHPKEDQNKAYLHLTKVGLRHIEYANVVQDLTLHTVPTSQWVEINFNRLILEHLPKDDELRQVYNSRLLDALTRQGNQSGLLSPSTLYVESATLTSDDSLIIGQKSAAAGSHFATIGRPWTTPVEGAVLWSNITDGAIAANAAMRQAVVREFTKKSETTQLPYNPISEQDIESVRWIGIALECHLNLALLSIVRLKTTWDEFRIRYRSKDYNVLKGIPCSDIPAQIFAPDQDGQWHTTARMRALYTLIDHYGMELTTNKIAAVRSPRR